VHQFIVSEAGNGPPEAAKVVARDGNPCRTGILGQATANVLNARQSQLSGSRIEASQHVIWYITNQHVTHSGNDIP
jgi:hypothetical protein